MQRLPIAVPTSRRPWRGRNWVAWQHYLIGGKRVFVVPQMRLFNVSVSELVIAQDHLCGVPVQGTAPPRDLLKAIPGKPIR